MPRSAVGIDTALSGLGQRSVHVASMSRRCRPIDRRTDQRMAEHDPWRHLQETVSCNLGTCELVDPEVLGSAPTQGPDRPSARQPLRGVGVGRMVGASLSVAGNSPRSGLSVGPTPVGRNPRPARTASTRAAIRAEQGGCHGLRRGYAREHQLVEGVGKRRTHRGRVHRLGPRPSRGRSGETVEIGGDVPSTEQQHDRLRPQTTSNDSECLRRLAIQPLGRHR